MIVDEAWNHNANRPRILRVFEQLVNGRDHRVDDGVRAVLPRSGPAMKALDRVVTAEDRALHGGSTNIESDDVTAPIRFNHLRTPLGPNANLQNGPG